MTDELPDDWMERTKLHFAARQGDLKIVAELLSAGFDANAFDELGKTPLHYAVENEHLAVVKFLLAHGADVNARDEPKIGNTPLGEVAAYCSFQMAEALVKAGADPNIEGWMRITALHLAAQRKKDEGRRVYDLLVKASKRHV